LKPDELEAYRELAKVYLALPELALDGYVVDGVLIEVKADG